MHGLGCARDGYYGVQGLGCAKRRDANTPQEGHASDKVGFCLKSFSKSLFFMTTHYIDVHIFNINV